MFTNKKYFIAKLLLAFAVLLASCAENHDFDLIDGDSYNPFSPSSTYLGADGGTCDFTSLCAMSRCIISISITAVIPRDDGYYDSGDSVNKYFREDLVEYKDLAFEDVSVSFIDQNTLRVSVGASDELRRIEIEARNASLDGKFFALESGMTIRQNYTLKE